MADRLTSLRPGPADCPLGGRPFAVPEATVGGLMALQAWVDSRCRESPGRLDAELAAAPTPEQRDRALLDAHSRLDEGGPAFDDEAGRLLLYGTGEGLLFFVGHVLGLEGDDLAAVVSEAVASPEGWAWLASVRRAYFGADRRREIEALLGIPRERPKGEPLTWAEAVVTLAKEYRWTLPDVYALSLSEFLACRRGGKPVESGFRGIPAAEMDAWVERFARAMESPRGDTSEG